MISTYGCSYLSYYGPPMLFPINTEVPIDLSKAGTTAEIEQKILFKDRYELYLRFFPSSTDNDSNEREWEYLNSLIGSWRHGVGQIIPVKLLVIKLEGKKEKILIDKEYFTKNMRGINTNSISRRLTVLHLEPGKYKIKIENQKDFPELSNVRVLLKVCYYGPK